MDKSRVKYLVSAIALLLVLTLGFDSCAPRSVLSRSVGSSASIAEEDSTRLVPKSTTEAAKAAVHARRKEQQSAPKSDEQSATKLKDQSATKTDGQPAAKSGAGTFTPDSALLKALVDAYLGHIDSLGSFDGRSLPDGQLDSLLLQYAGSLSPNQLAALLAQEKRLKDAHLEDDELLQNIDSLTAQRIAKLLAEGALTAPVRRDSLDDKTILRHIDSLLERGSDTTLFTHIDSAAVGQFPKQTPSIAQPKPRRAPTALLDDPITGKNKDSLVYDVRRKMVYIYNQGEVNYQNSSLKADYMEINMSDKMVHAYGKPDSLEGKAIVTKPEFAEGDAAYKMDTITYNLESKKAKIKGVATQQGDGWLIGGSVKKMADNTVNIEHGMYTTCDQTDHPHFYLAMTKAKVIPGKKVITGPAYLVMEDVPIYFLGIPEGFFPINMGPKSGLLMPSYGEEYSKGFFIRDLGYYFTMGDYADLAIRGGIYTLGSWEASAASRYIKRYKYSGSFNMQYSSVKTGEKGEPDYIKQSNFRLQWTHSQDPKANPGSTFSASVNFATSGYSKYSAQSLNDMLSTQTNSSIAYSKNWAGTPFSLSANMSVSQNSQNKSISVTLPTLVFNVSRFYPFKRKERLGKERWYEKIAMQYTGKMTNSVTTTESQMFSKETFDNMRNGIEHNIPISASFNLFNYINVSPSATYNEKWYFKKVEFGWDPVANKVDTLPTQYGFYRLYNYNFNVSASTTVYGMYDFTKKRKDRKIQAIRHTLTPSFGFTYTPDFGDPKYGYYKSRQTDSTGNFTTYSPYSVNAYGVPSSGRSMSMNFSLSQNLEMKVLSKRDTSGVKKIKLIDELRISGSYNFLADSMGLSTIPVSFRTTLFNNFGINLSLTLDPYRITPEGKRYNKLFFPGRVVSTGWSFGYTFKSREDRSNTAINDITSIPPEYMNPYSDPYGNMDPVLRRQYMAQMYYDFSLPWNFGFNYAVNYSISPGNYPPKGYKKNVTQTVSFNGSLNITPKTGITFQGGYDIKANKLTTSQVSISRDLHCWQMSFSWIPFGFHRSWSFNIGVKAASLQDLKYDKSQSMYDNLY